MEPLANVMEAFMDVAFTKAFNGSNSHGSFDENFHESFHGSNFHKSSMEVFMEVMEAFAEILEAFMEATSTEVLMEASA